MSYLTILSLAVILVLIALCLLTYRRRGQTQHTCGSLEGPWREPPPSVVPELKPEPEPVRPEKPEPVPAPVSEPPPEPEPSPTPAVEPEADVTPPSVESSGESDGEIEDPET